ncbi:MAG: hypothetical protein KatS3mg072_1254 [Meiothermus sp.]|nr:MAG: hypothetical protein KatS3mg072_1254 [Meiothermus sp.]
MEHQSYAYAKNHWMLESDLPALLNRYWKGWEAHRDEFESFGALAGGEAYRVADHVDKEARSVLVMHDLEGQRIDRVRLSPAQESLNRQLAAINRAPYQGGSWHLHFAQGFLLADPGLYCIQTITNATVYAIHKYAPQFAPWKEELLQGKAFGATWMTEVQGGSDLGANKVRAVPDGAVWRLYGDKYFSSGAGLTDYAIVSARPEGAPPGPKGVALFLVPRLDSNGALNYRVRRLKDKLATRAVPSGEVDFDHTEAYLIGKPEEGIYYILETLTLSRLANAVGALGLARKAQLEALFRARSRVAFGQKLEEHPLIRRDLTDLAVRIAGGLALTFRAVAAWEEAWLETPPLQPSLPLRPPAGAPGQGPHRRAWHLLHPARDGTIRRGRLRGGLCHRPSGERGPDYPHLGRAGQRAGPGHPGGALPQGGRRAFCGGVCVQARGCWHRGGPSGPLRVARHPGRPAGPFPPGGPVAGQGRPAHPGRCRYRSSPVRPRRRALRQAGGPVRPALPAKGGVPGLGDAGKGGLEFGRCCRLVQCFQAHRVAVKG